MSLLLLLLLLLFYFYIYTNAHTLNMNKISSKDDINNGWTCFQALKYHKLSPMRWPSQTKGLRINVCGIDNGNDVTILHVMNWGGSLLKVEKRWSRTSSKWDKKIYEEHNQWDMMECSSVMVGKKWEKDVPVGPRLMKLLNEACIH